MRSLSVGGGLLLSCWLVCGPAFAAPPAPAEDATQQAKNLYMQGDRAFNLGRYEEALAFFEKAYNAKAVTGLLYNVAQCHRLIGNLEQARRVYRSFLNQTTDTKLKAAAQEKLAEVESVLDAQAHSRVSGPTTLAPIDRAASPGEPVAALQPPPTAAPTVLAPPPPPPPKIVAVPVPEAEQPVPSAATTKPAAATTKPAAAPGKVAAASKPAAPSAPPAATSAEPAPPPKSQAAAPSSHLLFWSGLGLGVASAGTGLFFGAQSKSAQSTLSKGGLSRADADAQVSTMQRDATLGNVLLITSAVALVGAAACWFLEAP